MTRGYTLDELARHVDGGVHGRGDVRLVDVATLEQAGPEHLGFLTNPRYRKAAESSRAGALLVAPGSGIEGRDLLEVAEPYLALGRILELYHPKRRPEPGIAPEARVAPDAEIGDAVAIGPFVVVESGVRLGDRSAIGAGSIVGEGSRIGDETELKPRVVLYPGTEIGKRCLIHSGVVLGGDGYGFATSGGRHHKVPQLGRVVVEDDVEIGANTTVDRGTLGDTTIGEGAKIDNQVMIAHGVHVGARSLMAAQSGVAGSTRLGESTTFAGQSGAAGHLDIADGTIVAAKSAVFADTSRRAFLAGIPAIDHRRWKRSQAAVKRLPDMMKELRDLRARVEHLEKRLSGEEES